MSNDMPPPPPPGGYGAPPPPEGYGAQPGGSAQSGTNGKAIWSLVLGIVGLVVCGFVAGIPAIILGRMSRTEIDASGGAQGGRGLATAGFVLGIIACVWSVVYIILAVTGNGVSFNTSN